MEKLRLLLTVIALVTVSGCGQLATGSISGKVIDSSSGSPIPAAIVSTDPPTSAITTDAQGRYSIPHVPPGNYLVSANKSDYKSASVRIAVSVRRITTADVPLATEPTPVNPTSESISSGLVAYWSFDDGTATDNSGNRHHGTVYGATLVEDRHGNPHHAYYFNGVDSYIRVPHDPGIANLENAMSIAAWIKIDLDTGYEIYGFRHIVSKGATYGDLWADYALGLSNPAGALIWEYSSSSNSPVTMRTEAPIPQAQWHHVASTFDGQTIKLYLDGRLQKTFPPPYQIIRSSSQPLYIGCRYENPLVGVFKGSIDQVQIYSRALSDTEMQGLYYMQ